MPVFGANKTNCPRDDALISEILNYKSGSVDKFLKYDCLSDGSAKWHPFYWAVVSRGRPGNVKAAKAMLEADPSLVDFVNEYGKNILEVVVGSCCSSAPSDWWGNYKGRPLVNKEMAEALIDKGADVNMIVNDKVQVKYGGVPIKGTLLDYVRLIQTGDMCKQNGKSECARIEKLLTDRRAKTYEELNPTIQQQKPEQCPNGQIIKGTNCVNCKPCQTEHASCTVSSDGKADCMYNVQCERGYGDKRFDGEYLPGGGYNAKCTPNKYKITLNLNSGNGCDNDIHEFGKDLKIGCKPVRDNYDFAGWSQSDSEDDVAPEITIAANDIGNKVYYAQWKTAKQPKTEQRTEPKPNEYKYKFVLGDAVTIKNGCEDGTYKENETVTVKCEVARQGYTLESWHLTNKDGEIINMPYPIEKGAQGDITFYAKWRKNEVRSAPATDPCADANKTEMHATELGDDCKPTKCEKGYVLKDNECVQCPPCKNKTVTCDISVQNNQCVYKTECKNSGEIISDDGTSNANCVPDTSQEHNDSQTDLLVKGDERDANETRYNIDYNFDEGHLDDVELPTEYVAGQELIITEKEPIRENYIFDGWCLDGRAECDKVMKILDTDTGDKKFVAKWVAKNDTNPAVVENQSNDENNKKDSQTPKPQVDNSQRVADAEKAYNAAYDAEQSTENRILGGTTIAATGLGGMQLAQGLAEQAADRAAEEDMKAYIATFKCSIGEKGPKNYNGGTKGITTPVLTQFTDLYQDYKNTAGQLKIRKEALGMTPGIEAELVLEAKDTDSLYDDVGHGIENRTQASLYRSLTGDADDANALNDKKETSATRVKGGAAAVGAGVVGGVAGNLLINHNDSNDKVELDIDKAKELINQYGNKNITQ